MVFCILLGAGIIQSVQWLGYGSDDRGSIPDTGREFLLFIITSRLALGPAQPPIQFFKLSTRP